MTPKLEKSVRLLTTYYDKEGTGLVLSETSPDTVELSREGATVPGTGAPVRIVLGGTLATAISELGALFGFVGPGICAFLAAVRADIDIRTGGNIYGRTEREER